MSCNGACLMYEDLIDEIARLKKENEELKVKNNFLKNKHETFVTLENAQLLDEVKELKRVIDKVIKNVGPYIMEQSKGQYKVPATLWKAQIAMSELKKEVE